MPWNEHLLSGFCYLIFMTILTVLTILYYIRNIVIIVHIVNGFQPYLPAVGATAPPASLFQYLHTWKVIAPQRLSLHYAAQHSVVAA